LTKFALGTVQFGMQYGIANKTGQVDFNKAKDILNLAKKIGINTLDTAISYGDSEKNLGKIGINNFKVITKLPILPKENNDIKKWIFDQTKNSLDRLKLKKIYCLLLHRPIQQNKKYVKLLRDGLEMLKKLKIVEKIGVSIYSTNELKIINQLYEVDLIQAPFNLIDRRLYATGWLDKLKSMGVEVHVRSIFLQGLLLMKKNNIPTQFSKWLPLWNKWHDWQEQNSISATQACISFINRFPQIDKIVVGVESRKQLKQIFEMSKKNCDYNFPDLSCNDENLINPSKWETL
jgi:hypothetical protein